MMEVLSPHPLLRAGLCLPREDELVLGGHADHRGWHAVHHHPSLLVGKLFLSRGCV